MCVDKYPGAYAPPAVTGQPGPPGPQGPPGVRGSLWFSGAGAPPVTGNFLPGDQYLDTVTGNVYQFG
jgi:hypothetical protein